MGRKSKPMKERLLAKIGKQEDGCWLWTAATVKANAGRYGIIRESAPSKKLVYAHRASYELFVGEIPEGHQVRHQCHNTLCVNPEHLLTGTQSDNEQDKVKADRYAKFRNGNEKYAAIIWELHEAGAGSDHIAKELGLHSGSVWNMIQKLKKRKKLGKSLFSRV